MRSKLIAQNALFNIIRVTVILLLPIVVFPYVSRKLGPVSLGRVDFAESVVSYFVMIAAMGIPAYGKIVCAKARQSEEELQKTVCELIYINFALEVIAYSALILTIFLVPKLHQYRAILILNSLAVLVSVISVEWLYVALEKFRYIAIRSIMLKFISVILIFALIRSPDDYIWYTGINIFFVVGSALMDFILAHRYIHFYNPKELDISRHIAPVLVFFASSVAITISSNTDIVMLNLFDGEYQTGLYTFSVRIKSMLVSLMVAGLDVVVPRLSMLHKEGFHDDFRSLIKTAGIFTFVVSCAIASYFIVFSNETVCILGGSEYASAAYIVIVFMLCLIVLSVNFTLGVGVLQVIGRERLFARALLLACLFNVVANCILIPAIHATGAALATLLSECVILFLFYKYCRDYIGGAFAGCHLTLVAAAAGFAGIICRIGKGYILQGNPLLQMIFFLVVFMIIYCPLIYAVSSETREFVKDLISKKGA